MFNKACEARRPANPAMPRAVMRTPDAGKNTSNGSIANYYKKSASPAASTASFRGVPNAKPTNPSRLAPVAGALNPRSTNIVQPVSSRSDSQPDLSGRSKSFASICSQSNSFKEESSYSFVSEGNTGSRHAGAAPAVYFEPSDFSDDENLDLDYQCPSVLPPPPPQPKPVEEQAEMPPPSTCLTWSQSSPSHYRPPQPRSDGTRKDSAKLEAPIKRESSVKREAAEVDPPVVKKRTLPKHWQKPTVKYEECDDAYNYGASAAPTPVSKLKDPPLWDATASAIKAQKKQLKNQHKKPTGRDAEEGADEAHKPRTSRTASKPTVISLSSEQRHVKSLVCEQGKSVFFTGPAGTGKSVLMRSIIQELKKKYARDPERLGVTASTGLAACNIGGMTLHSFAGIGLGKEDAQALVKRIRKNPKAKNRWQRTKTLIIDEISMVDAELFDKLSQIGRVIRNNGKPWGGIQLIITGDFFQLPPVPDGDKKREVKFAFDAATWNTSIDHTIGLTEVFRQKDPIFANMLNEMRLGKISDETVQAFKSLARPLRFDDGLEVTELFPTRNEVERSNDRRLAELTGKPFRYECFDTGDPAFREKLLQNVMAPKVLVLKQGAQVMLIKNMDDGLVNGSLGTVTGFITEEDFRAGFGIEGEGALETTGDLDAKKRSKLLNRFLADGSGAVPAERYPLVRFHAVDGSQRVILCMPEEWKVELPTGEVQASRKQLPLILAWALSIHKAQGQTLERVKVDLGKVFEKGQAYVALSRATSQQGLQVLRFEKQKVMAHPRVVQFYDKLYSAESALKFKPKPSILAHFPKAEPDLDLHSPAFGQRAMKAFDSDDELEAMESSMAFA